MTIATLRVCIGKPTYMTVDGQPQIVQSGSVIDLPAGVNLSPSSLQPGFAEAMGTLAAHGGATPVRNLRTSR